MMNLEVNKCGSYLVNEMTWMTSLKNIEEYNRADHVPESLEERRYFIKCSTFCVL